MVTVRLAEPGDAHGIARVHVDSWHTTYTGIIPDTVIAGMSVERRESYWRRLLTEPDRADIVFVAEEGRIVGFASGGPEREGHAGFDGELYAIYLLESHQRTGIGRKLTHHLVGGLAERGMSAMLVWVLAENPACRFYEALGGRKIAAKTASFGGKELKEIAYGWEDLSALRREL